MADRIEHERPDLAPVDARGLGMAFSHFGHRPKRFERATSDALNPLAEADGRFEGRVLEFAAAHREREREEQRALWHGLRPLERALVWRMLDTRERFRPFDGDALAFYDKVVGIETPAAKPITRSRVQNAPARLRDHDPPVIRKSARGEYTVADASMQDWYVHSKEIGRWPPPASGLSSTPRTRPTVRAVPRPNSERRERHRASARFDGPCANARRDSPAPRPK